MSKRYRALLASTLLLFACLFSMLCYFNRLATDDYYFIWDVRHHGVITGVTSQYMEWCGRFASTFMMDLFYKWLDVNHTYYSFIPFISAALLFIGVFSLLRNIGKKIQLPFTKTHRMVIAGSFTALLFFLSADIGESWFWFCGLSSYLWSIIAFVWACVFLSNTKQLALSVFLAALCFVYIGGASEVYSVMYGIFFTGFLVIKYRGSQNLNVFISEQKRFLFLYAVFAISFLVFLLAPGNYLRDGLFPEHQFWYSFFITAKSFVKFGIFYLPFRLPYIFLFAVPLMWIGNEFRSAESVFFQQSFKSFFIKTTAVFVLALFIFFFMVAYVMVETGPPRIWFFVSFMLSTYLCLLFFYAGVKGALKQAYIRFVEKLFYAFGIGILGFHIYNEYQIAADYSKAVDERIAFIKELNTQINTDTLIYLKALPPPGMLYSTEISTDTSHFTNKELRLGYELKFHVALNR